jgi:hypothetical protein
MSMPPKTTMTLIRLLAGCLLPCAFAATPLRAETFEVTRADDPDAGFVPP